MSYENKILQMKKLLQKKEASKVERPVFQRPDRPSYIKAWEQAGLELVENDFGVLFRRVVTFPYNYVHGYFPLSDFHQSIEKWETAAFQHPFSLSLDEDVLFYDTETTGLKGTGTQIFLLGMLEPLPEGFRLVQLVLADPANEAAFLFESKLWQINKTMISYNGKSFDWPQIQTRWTLNKEWIPRLREQRQIDLLHSSKRIWKNDLMQLQLKQVEESKLGFSRKDDIPGYLAPIIYLDAVKSGVPDALIKVLKHNEWDLLSLITLYSHSASLLFDEFEEENAITFTNIGKWYADLKEHSQSTHILNKVTSKFNVLEAKDAHFYLAQQKKREKAYQEAVEYYLSAIHFVDERKRLQIYEDLAIIYEHYLTDLMRALEYAKSAIELVTDSNLWSSKQKHRQLIKWEKRLKRLEMKNHFPGKRKN